MQKYTQNLKVLDGWSPGRMPVLGLALTDGNVNKLMTRVTFYSSDVQMLEIVKQFFESTHPILLHNRSAERNRERR